MPASATPRSPAIGLPLLSLRERIPLHPIKRPEQLIAAHRELLGDLVQQRNAPRRFRLVVTTIALSQTFILNGNNFPNRMVSLYFAQALDERTEVWPQFILAVT